MKLIKYLIFLGFIANIFASPTVLYVKQKQIIVNGQPAIIDTIEDGNGNWGYFPQESQGFDVIVKNQLKESTVIHWHGLLLPNSQDGTELTQAPIKPGGEYHYQFKLQQGGTYWMHSHYMMQEQELAEAPLIIQTSQEQKYQQVVIVFQDFAFKSPEQIMSRLINGRNMADMDMSDMDMSKMPMDLNDVTYDAFLTNYHTLESPSVITVDNTKPIRLRFINGSATTNFWLNLGKLTGTAIAVDGKNIQPIKGTKFQLAVAQRMDVIVNLPKGVFPILGQVEGIKNQTGLILRTNSSLKVPHVQSIAKHNEIALNNKQELYLHALTNLPSRKIEQTVDLTLDGSMQDYRWGINKQLWPHITPIKIKQGNRVEMIIKNNTLMSHPIHLHGIVFQIVEINGHKFNGAVRDTVLVTPGEKLKIIFDANEKGKWLLHCHMLYHMHSGMMTYFNVE